MRWLQSMNKNAFAGMAIVDFWGFVLLILLIFGFGIIFTISGILSSKSTRLLQEDFKQDASMMLTGMLRYDLGDSSLGEHIARNIDNKAEVEIQIKKVMQELCNSGNSCFWDVEIIRKGETVRINGNAFNTKDFEMKVSADFLLPSKDEKIIFRLVRYFGLRDVRDIFPGKI